MNTLDYRWSAWDYFWWYVDDEPWWYAGLAVMPSWIVIKARIVQ